MPGVYDDKQRQLNRVPSARKQVGHGTATQCMVG
jgi:hypothetical protein